MQPDDGALASPLSGASREGRALDMGRRSFFQKLAALFGVAALPPLRREVPSPKVTLPLKPIFPIAQPGWVTGSTMPCIGLGNYGPTRFVVPQLPGPHPYAYDGSGACRKCGQWGGHPAHMGFFDGLGAKPLTVERTHPDSSTAQPEAKP